MRIALLVGILIIATFLRFYHFTSTPPGLYPDEAVNGNNAIEAATTGHLQVFYTDNNGREGLYINLLAVLFGPLHAPNEPWVVRLPAAVAGVLTVLGLYFLVTELFGAGTGLLASFLLATSFWHINFSRIGFRAILAPLLLAWALYFFIRAIKATRDRAAAWYAVAAGVVYALGFYTYISYRVTPLLFLLFIPFYRKHPAFWKRTLIFIVATFIVAAPIGWYFVKHPGDFFGRTTEIAVTNSTNPVGHFAVNFAKTIGMLNFHGDDNWRHNLSGAPELFWPIGLLFLLGAALGIYWLVRAWRARDDRSFGLWLSLAWLVLAALPAAASDEGIPHALRSILMLPPALILAAVGGTWLYALLRAHWNRTLAAIVAAIVLLAVGAYGYYEYFVLWASDSNVPGAFAQNYVDVGRALNDLPTSTPKYVFVDAGGVLVKGIPMPAETTMFITNTFLPEGQAVKNIHYVLPADESKISIDKNLVFFIR